MYGGDRGYGGYGGVADRGGFGVSGSHAFAPSGGYGQTSPRAQAGAGGRPAFSLGAAAAPPVGASRGFQMQPQTSGGYGQDPGGYGGGFQARGSMSASGNFQVDAGRGPAGGPAGGPDGGPAASSDRFGAAAGFLRRSRSPANPPETRPEPQLQSQPQTEPGSMADNPPRARVAQQTGAGDPRPTFSLASYGITGDNAAALAGKSPKPADGTDGTDGTDGADGADGADAKTDGTDGASPPTASFFNRQMAAATRASAAPRRAETRRPLLTSSSLGLYLYFGALWAVVYFLFTFAIFLWKGSRLPYPQTAHQRWGLEFAYLFVVYALVEPARLALARMGNKGAKRLPTYASFALAAPTVGLHCYYAFAQTYVLRVDVALNAASIAFVGAQCLLGFFAAGAFPSGTPAGAVRRVAGGAGAGAGRRIVGPTVAGGRTPSFRVGGGE